MKILRFNENSYHDKQINFTLFDTRKSWEDYETLRNNIITKIRELMNDNGSDISLKDKDDVFMIIDPNVDNLANVEIASINNDGNLKTIYGDIIEIYDIYVMSDLILILDWINKKQEYTYQYQKHIILNNPDSIGKITDKLNKKILKEYPDLNSGKDLNLI